jgi:hypothetical protein
MIHKITVIKIWLINRACTMFIYTVLKQSNTHWNHPVLNSVSVGKTTQDEKGLLKLIKQHFY